MGLPRVQLSSDGSKALIVWEGADASKAHFVESTVGAIAGTVASWGSVTRVISSSDVISGLQAALSADGARAFAVWEQGAREGCLSTVGSVASVSGSAASWGRALQISGQGTCVSDSNLGSPVWAEPLPFRGWLERLPKPPS